MLTEHGFQSEQPKVRRFYRLSSLSWLLINAYLGSYHCLIVCNMRNQVFQTNRHPANLYVFHSNFP